MWGLSEASGHQGLRSVQTRFCCGMWLCIHHPTHLCLFLSVSVSLPMFLSVVNYAPRIILSAIRSFTLYAASSRQAHISLYAARELYVILYLIL